MSRVDLAGEVPVQVRLLLQMLLLLAGCGGGDPLVVLGQDSSRSEDVPVRLDNGVVRDMLCTGESWKVNVRHQYRVTVWSNESIAAFCQADDGERQASNARAYDDREGVTAAWAECVVDLPASIEGARSTIWRYRSHVTLNSAGVVYGEVEPGDGLRCHPID